MTGDDAPAAEDDAPAAEDNVSADGSGALAAENHRLRVAHADATGSQYRLTALALVGVGILAFVAALAFPSVREVLVAIGGAGVVLGIVTAYVPAGDNRPRTLDAALYGTLATNESGVCDALDLSDRLIYAPVADGQVRLVVPRNSGVAAADLPDRDALTSVFVDRGNDNGESNSDGDGPWGATFEPTGKSLLAETEAADGPLAGSDPEGAADRLCRFLVDRATLVASADPSVDAEAGRARVTVGESAFGPLDGFDHPAVSVLGAGLATALDRPVSVTVTAGEGRDGESGGTENTASDGTEDGATAGIGDEADADREGGAVVTCRWATDDGGSGP